MGIRKTVSLALSTLFYVGYLPLVPGTFGSMAGLIFFYFIKNNTTAYLLFTAALITLGFLISGRAERILNKKDAPCIVIDEASGMLVSLIFLPYDIRLVVIGFVIFRVLDALKPYPADRLQSFKGSLGIMSDDLVAGLYTNILLQVVLRIASFKTS